VPDAAGFSASALALGARPRTELVQHCRTYLEGMIAASIPLDSTLVHRDDYARAIDACVRQMDEPARLYPARINGKLVYV